jgi:hypothetical protein
MLAPGALGNASHFDGSLVKKASIVPAVVVVVAVTHKTPR